MPDFVVEGDPSAIRARASTMSEKGRLFFDTGDALAGIDTSGWVGRAADQVREAHDLEPDRWIKAGNGFVTASGALVTYAAELEAARSVADWAREEYARGDAETERARVEHGAYMDRMRAYWASGGTDVAEPFSDSGEALRSNALRELAAARVDLDNAANVCAGRVRAGCADAPEEPHWWESGLRFVGGVFEGAGEAIWDLLTMVPFSPVNLVIDAYNLASDDLTTEELATRYELAGEDALDMAQGIYRGLREDPLEFGKNLGKSLLDWDTWADDPARALGHLVPDAIAAAATAGTGALATRGIKGGADLLDGLSDLSRVDNVSGLNRIDHLSDLERGLRTFDDVPQGPQGTYRGLDDPDLDAWLDDVARRHPELDRQGVRGVWDYTTDDGYDTMNAAMRGDGPIDPAVQDRIDATRHGLDQLPDYEGTTFRGTNLPDSVIDHINSGGNLRDEAFSSSSIDPRVADDFIDHSKDNPTKITIEGHSGSNVGPFSAARSEAEILFKGGTEFRVLDNYVDADGLRHVRVEEIR